MPREKTSLAEQNEFLDFAKSKDFASVRALVTSNPDLVNKQPSGRWSALHHAVESGDEKTIQLLVDKKADLTLRTSDGRTPWDLSPPSIRPLLEGGRLSSAVAAPASSARPAPLRHAATAPEPGLPVSPGAFSAPRSPSGYPDPSAQGATQSVERQSLPPVARPSSFEVFEDAPQPLPRTSSAPKLAAEDSHASVISGLSSFQPGEPTESEKIAFLDSAQLCDFKAVRALVSMTPAIVNAQPGGRWSALHYAAHAGDKHTIRFLIEANADISAKASDGNTPLDVAHQSVRSWLSLDDEVMPLPEMAGPSARIGRSGSSWNAGAKEFYGGHIINVSGATDELLHCNGTYRQVGMHNAAPMYKHADCSAIVYYGQMWQLQSTGETDGYTFASQVSRSGSTQAMPPSGAWVHSVYSQRVVNVTVEVGKSGGPSGATVRWKWADVRAGPMGALRWSRDLSFEKVLTDMAGYVSADSQRPVNTRVSIGDVVEELTFPSAECTISSFRAMLARYSEPPRDEVEQTPGGFDSLDPIDRRGRTVEWWAAIADYRRAAGLEISGKLLRVISEEAKLGEGSFGAVWRMKDRGSDMWVAVKTVAVPKKNDTSLREHDVASVLRAQPHPGIVKIFAEQWFEEAKMYALILELCPGGDLLVRVARRREATGRGSLYKPPDEARQWLGQVLLGLEHLHLTIVMLLRDLKPENVLLDSNDCAKLTDFGFGKVGTVSKNMSLGHPTGSPGYIAPELLRGKKHDFHADLYSYGVLVWLLSTGGMASEDVPIPPTGVDKMRNGNDYRALFEDWRALAEAASVSATCPDSFDRSEAEEARELVLRLIQKNPANRPDHAGIRGHPYLASLEMPFRFEGPQAVTVWLWQLRTQAGGQS